MWSEAGSLPPRPPPSRFPDRAHFASWNGTAPIDASSGEQVRHRLSRAGNRQINRVLHIVATVQLRNATEGRSLKRRLSDHVYQTMINDTMAAAVTGPG